MNFQMSQKGNQNLKKKPSQNKRKSNELSKELKRNLKP